jgi:RND family efflux transporter MFP subunit
MPPDLVHPTRWARRLRLAGVFAAVIIGVLVIQGVTTRRMADARLSQWTETQSVPVVAVALPTTKGQPMAIDLPGRLEAYTQAQIFARVSGYIKEWKVDIGTPVKAGQLLAEIDAPDLDQQIMQAQADLASAQANATLAKANLERGQSLIQSGSVSKQDLDQRSADFASKQGAVRSMQANLERLRVLEKYKRIVAPFDGFVTARATDVGALINAGAGGGPALFVVSDTSKLRAYVNVPQNYVPYVKIGTNADISVPEYPGQTFPATVEASARSVEVGSGTTRMLLVVDNAAGQLMTGAYATVRLQVPGPESAVNVPASALIFDRNGLRVATLDSADRVVLKSIKISRDLGNTVEIASGLKPDDRIIVSPPDGIAAGDTVRVGGSRDASQSSGTATSPLPSETR